MSHDRSTRYVQSGGQTHAEPSATTPLAPPIFQTTAYRYADTDQIDRIHSGEDTGLHLRPLRAAERESVRGSNG